MRPVACNLCGADAFQIVFAEGEAQVHRVVRCNKCQLMYANPRLAEVEGDDILTYDPAYLPELLAQGDSRLDKEKYQVADYNDSRQYLAQRFPGRGDLFEVGSSYGYLLAHFQQDGWRVQGVEPNALNARYASEYLGLSVKAALLPDAQLPSGSKDAALMMHVIEHVPDPKATLQEIHRILKTKGMLIMETPRYDSWVFRLLGRRERSMSCDGHIYFFTVDTLSKLSEQAGFDVLKTDIVGRSLSLDRLLWNVGVVSKSKAIASTLSKLSESLGLHRVRFKLNFRDMQRIYLVKH